MSEQPRVVGASPATVHPRSDLHRAVAFDGGGMWLWACEAGCPSTDEFETQREAEMAAGKHAPGAWLA